MNLTYVMSCIKTKKKLLRCAFFFKWLYLYGCDLKIMNVVVQYNCRRFNTRVNTTNLYFRASKFLNGRNKNRKEKKKYSLLL